MEEEEAAQRATVMIVTAFTAHSVMMTQPTDQVVWDARGQVSKGRRGRQGAGGGKGGRR